ncbi:hypothetical protein HMPREF1556_00801 [Porphyromonas sp. oral taxon 278 str. W7784]|nr:hypothetical protein HMPREF1556_00801 [Porphyromonas sp. oral taxon 278 str. W7784]
MEGSLRLGIDPALGGARPSLLRALRWGWSRGIATPSRGGKKGPYGRSSKKPTVGRLDDPQWVGEATYSRFFLPPSRAPLQPAW